MSHSVYLCYLCYESPCIIVSVLGVTLYIFVIVIKTGLHNESKWLFLQLYWVWYTYSSILGHNCQPSQDSYRSQGGKKCLNYFTLKILLEQVAALQWITIIRWSAGNNVSGYYLHNYSPFHFPPCFKNCFPCLIADQQ